MFVNVYFGAQDRHLNDSHLLQGILSRIQTQQASLTLWPESQGAKNCFSFQVPGNNQAQIYAEAARKVNTWIRNLPTHGLPFNRANIF